MTKGRKYILSVIVLLLSACGTSAPTRFYTITPVEQESSNVAYRGTKSIGVDVVEVPGYVTRPQIVTTKDAGYELVIAEFDRWGEPVSNTIQRVVSENINHTLKISSIRPIQGSRSLYDYRIIVEVLRFDAELGKTAYLDAWWSILDKNGRVIETKHIKLETPIGETYSDLVRGQSKIISDLSLDVAKRVSKIK